MLEHRSPHTHTHPSCQAEHTQHRANQSLLIHLRPPFIPYNSLENVLLLKALLRGQKKTPNKQQTTWCILKTRSGSNRISPPGTRKGSLTTHLRFTPRENTVQSHQRELRQTANYLNTALQSTLQIFPRPCRTWCSCVIAFAPACFKTSSLPISSLLCTFNLK